ncbi:hypothetical protein L484_028085 [Morus notabilis]|uniref:Uncharacterized protein n=1 Tax=Morus notabilis TaxID=981085 RepID=W9S7X1_9ROSA|nr:hypothetical protein L484_028085 [Morus notabilis]
MPEARDRLSRPVDVAAMFARRRSAAVQVLVDDTENGADLFRSPIRQQPAAMATGVRTPMDTTRSSSAAAVASRENTPAPGIVRRGRGRGRSGVLPYWYPRTPLRDITAIARAIERTRARLREDEGQDVASPAPQEQGFLDPSVSVSVAPLEHNIITTSLHSAFRRKPCPPSVGKVPKILLGIANQTTAGSECLTPQKKLLNSIDTVEKESQTAERAAEKTANPSSGGRIEVVDVMVMGVEERQTEVLVQVLQVLRRNASASQQFWSTSTHSRRSTIMVKEEEEEDDDDDLKSKRIWEWIFIKRWRQQRWLQRVNGVPEIDEHHHHLFPANHRSPDELRRCLAPPAAPPMTFGGAHLVLPPQSARFFSSSSLNPTAFIFSFDGSPPPCLAPPSPLLAIKIEHGLSKLEFEEQPNIYSGIVSDLKLSLNMARVGGAYFGCGSIA